MPTPRPRPALTLLGCALSLLTACTTQPTRSDAGSAPPPAQAALNARLADAPLLPYAGGAPESTESSNADKAPATQALTTEPLSQDAAVRLSVLNSPALRALVSQSEAQAARARAQSRPGVLSLSLERLRRGDEVEVGRSLSIGLLDILTWPWRSQAADKQIDAGQQQLARDVLNHVQAVRQQWVRAVAAQQREAYQGDVLLAAQTSAQLAQRMQSAGHFSAAQAAQQVLVESEAQLTQAQARQQTQREREALLRLLGASGDQARALRLPERLPAVPITPEWNAPAAFEAARTQGLGTRVAQAQWQASRRTASDDAKRSLLDIDVGWQRKTTGDGPAQQGPDLSLRLSAIDFGAARRQAGRLEERAALARLEQTTLAAESSLREALAGYQAAHQMARHTSEVLQPLRQRLLGERVKQYNGMLIGPIELLGEARAHAGSVIQALDAQRDFWLADATLHAAIDGSNTPAAAASTSPSATTTLDATH